MNNFCKLILVFITIIAFYRTQEIDSTNTTQQLPLYCGIFSPDDNETYYKVHNFINNGLNALREKYPNDLALYPPELSAFKYPPSFHVTCLYIGGNASLTSSIYYKDFITGYHVNVTGRTLVYVPEKIMCMPVFPDQSVIKIQNEFPHTTLNLNEWSAVMSNDAVAGLSQNQSAPLHNYYYQGNLSDPNFYLVEKYENVTIDQDVVTAYVAQIPTNYFFYEGVTKKCLNAPCNETIN